MQLPQAITSYTAAAAAVAAAIVDDTASMMAAEVAGQPAGMFVP